MRTLICSIAGLVRFVGLIVLFTICTGCQSQAQIVGRLFRADLNGSLQAETSEVPVKKYRLLFNIPPGAGDLAPRGANSHMAAGTPNTYTNHVVSHTQVLYPGAKRDASGSMTGLVMKTTTLRSETATGAEWTPLPSRWVSGTRPSRLDEHVQAGTWTWPGGRK